MEKAGLEETPEVIVPEGYTLRHFQPGDEAALGRIYAASELGCKTPELVRQRMLGDPCYLPERIFVVEHGNNLAATAAAWVGGEGAKVSYLHMVGSLPAYRGKGLGMLVCSAATDYARREGFQRQRLQTDDFRTPAIRLYLKLGYDPLIADDTHSGRWQALAEKMGQSEILERLRPDRPNERE